MKTGYDLWSQSFLGSFQRDSMKVNKHDVLQVQNCNNHLKKRQGLNWKLPSLLLNYVYMVESEPFYSKLWIYPMISKVIKKPQSWRKVQNYYNYIPLKELSFGRSKSYLYDIDISKLPFEHSYWSPHTEAILKVVHVFRRRKARIRFWIGSSLKAPLNELDMFPQQPPLRCHIRYLSTWMISECMSAGKWTVISLKRRWERELPWAF